MSREQDRELLERAARAAGYTVEVCGTVVLRTIVTGITHHWHPLESDADAFRLMVDCGITAHQYSDCVAADSHRGMSINCEESFGTDKHAATRRAIVRAAAAMSEGQ